MTCSASAAPSTSPGRGHSFFDLRGMHGKAGVDGMVARMQSEVERVMVAEVSPHLVQGEAITALGVLLENTKQRRNLPLEEHAVLLVVATNWRLVLLEGKGSVYGGGLGAAEFHVAPTFGTDRPRHWPPPVMLSWWYQDLQAVETALEAHLFWKHHKVQLTARHPALGVGGDRPQRLYHAVAQFVEVPGHAQFIGQFIPWLAQQVAAGAFPLTPQRQALVQQHEQARHQSRHVAMAQAAAVSAQQAESAKRRNAKLGARSTAGLVGRLGLVVLGAALLGLAVVAWVGGSNTKAWKTGRIEEVAKAVELDEEDVGWSKSGKEPPTDCPDKGLADWREALYPDAPKPNWERDKICHGCWVFAKEPTGKLSKNLTRVARKGEIWFCPAPDRYQAQLEADKTKLEDMKSSSQSSTPVLVSASLAGVGLVLLALGVALIVLGRRAMSPSA